MTNTRRASILLFVLAFIAMSEGAALCLTMLPGTVSDRQITFFDQPDTGASAELRSSSDFRSGSAPLYLQHLSLLI